MNYILKWNMHLMEKEKARMTSGLKQGIIFIKKAGATGLRKGERMLKKKRGDKLFFIIV